MAELQKHTSLPGNFVYENEHPQINLSFLVLVGDRQLTGKSLSLIEARAQGLLAPTSEDTTYPVTLRFDFEGFTVSLHLQSKITTTPASEDPEVLLTFTDPTGPHLAALRYIINSYIAGDITSLSGLLGYSGPVSVKQKPQGTENSRSVLATLGQGLRKLAIVAVSCGLIYQAAGVIQNHFVYAFDPRPVLVTLEGLTLRATAAGQITFADPNAEEGQVAYSITSNSGDFLSVKMPCDCKILPTDEFVAGATVLPGTPLMQLVAADANPFAETDISLQSAARVMAGDESALVFEDGQSLPVRMTLQKDPDPSGDLLTARLHFEDPEAAAQFVGKAAQLRFQRDLPGRDLLIDLKTYAEAKLNALGVN